MKPRFTGLSIGRKPHPGPSPANAGDAYQRKPFSAALRMTHDRGDAEDLVQEDRADPGAAFRPPVPLRTW